MSLTMMMMYQLLVYIGTPFGGHYLLDGNLPCLWESPPGPLLRLTGADVVREALFFR